MTRLPKRLVARRGWPGRRCSRSPFSNHACTRPQPPLLPLMTTFLTTVVVEPAVDGDVVVVELPLAPLEPLEPLVPLVPLAPLVPPPASAGAGAAHVSPSRATLASPSTATPCGAP